MLSKKEQIEMMLGDFNIKVPRFFLNHLAALDSLVLTALLYRQRKAKNDYFECSREWVQCFLSISEKQEKSVMRNLRSLGYITIERQGCPAVRFVRVDVDKCVALVTKCRVAQKGHSSRAQKGHSPRARIFIPYSFHKKKEEKENSGHCAEKNLKEEITEGFFQETTDIEPFKELARQLHKILAQHRMIKRLPNITEWARDLKKLHIQDGVSYEDINLVIQWYSKTCGNTYIPKACSASTFRKKFDSLFSTMDSKKQDEKIIPSKQAVDISIRLKSKGWTVRALELLPTSIEKSICFVSNAQHKMNTLKEQLMIQNKKLDNTIGELKAQKNKEYQVNERIIALIRHLDQKIGAPFTFVEMWFMQVHLKVKNWSTWNGNLQSYVLDQTNDNFKNCMLNYTNKWCSDPTRYLQIESMLYAD